MTSRCGETIDTKRLAAARARSRPKYRRHHNSVTETTVAEQRQLRDAVWQGFRRGEQSMEAGGDRYEHEVAIADQLADRRQHDTAAVERAETLDRDSGMLVAEIEELQKRALPPPMRWRKSIANGALTLPNADWAN